LEHIPSTFGEAMQVGDKVKHIVNSTGFLYLYDTIYTVVELEADDFVKVKHPSIGGHFHFKKKNLEIAK
tara:strand:+ start:97 stop:303 length:207 start_codon:yes stop_codon:yes gene_type:complete